MRDEFEPTVGKWYLNIDLDEQFRVVAIDEEREVVEIRYLDGEADEIELDAWSDLDLEAAEPPEGEDEDEEDEEDEKRGGGSREPDAGEADDWEDDEEDDEDDLDEDEDEYGPE
jgi:hypothetical protein